jgi:hypothetical protein
VVQMFFRYMVLLIDVPRFFKGYIRLDIGNLKPIFEVFRLVLSEFLKVYDLKKMLSFFDFSRPLKNRQRIPKK